MKEIKVKYEGFERSEIVLNVMIWNEVKFMNNNLN